MPFLFIYLLKLSVSLAVVFTFYHFVLRKLTFYNWNRYYLIGYSFLSFFIALINVGPVLERNEWSQNSIVQWVPVIQASATGVQANTPSSSLSVSQWIILFILAGMLVMLVRLLVQLISFRRMTRKAVPIAIGGIPGSNMKLYQVDEDIIPFSFGNSIFINHHLHTKDELREIVWHEFIHVKQKHSFDIIGGELLCLLNWYNPFAWLLRRSIRQNLEFIADNKVLENGVDRKEYQYLLLKVIGNKHFSIAPKFNFSSLKKRIAMMNKLKSTKRQLLRMLFLLPATAVLLVAFRNQYEAKHAAVTTEAKVARDTIPVTGKKQVKMPKEIASVNVIQTSGDANVSDAVKQKTAGMVIIKRTDGQIESYDLDNKESMEKFEKKYGVKLEDIVPPPPPPPPVPVDATPAIPPTPPTPPVKSNNEATPVAAGTNDENINLSRMSSEFEITDKKAWIKLKDGKVENYDLTNAKEKAAFESKYGKIYNLNLNTAVSTNVNTDIRTTVRPVIATTVNSNLKTNVSTGINTSVNVAPVAVTSSEPVTVVGYPISETHGGVTSVRTVPSRVTGRIITPSPVMTVTGDYTNVITGKEDIVIKITRNTTRQELDNFITQMKAKGVELEFDDIEYNDKGKLIHLSGTMKSGGSKSNFVVTDFATLVLAMIKKGDKTWFKVNTTDNEVI